MRALISRMISIKNAYILVSAVIIYSHIAYSFGYANITEKETHVGARYIQMIEGQPAPAPYCYRIGIPFLCFGNQNMGWVWLGLGYLLSSVGLYRLTAKVTRSDRAAWFAMLLFLLWYEVKNNFVWFAIPDGMATAALIWSMIAMLDRKIMIAFIVAALGVLCREVALFAIPTMLVFTYRDDRNIVRVCGYSAVLICVYIAITALAHPAASDFPNESGSIVQLFLATAKSFQGQIGTWEWTWSCIALLVPLFVAGVIRFPDKRLLVGALPVLLIFFVLDTPRMYLFAAAGIFPVAGYGFHQLLRRHDSIFAAVIASCFFIALASNIRDMAWMMFFVIAILLGWRKDCGEIAKEGRQ